MPDFKILIQKWYRQNCRNLPWRNTDDPYLIWLSEIILQQTRVDQGMDYYHRFANAFPTIAALATAPEDEVLNLWQGLGYYSRARNLQTAAKQIIEDYSGVFPQDYKEIIQLKGVGDYTASAISSIAFNQAHAVVDGNVYRVLSRYLAIDEPIDSGKGKKLFKEVAQELIDAENPGEYNQAIMELGALVCLPKNPDCQNCPVAESCQSRRKGNQLDFPVKSKKTKISDRVMNYLLVTDGWHLYIKKRGPNDIWQGLYDFPVKEIVKVNKKDLLDWKNEFGGSTIVLDGEHKHILSHQRITARFYIVSVKALQKRAEYQIIPIQDLEDFPLPQLLIRYIRSSRIFNGE